MSPSFYDPCIFLTTNTVPNTKEASHRVWPSPIQGWTGVRGNEKSDYTSIFLRNFEGSFIYNSSLLTIKCNNNAMFSFLRCFPRRSSELYIFSLLSKIQEVTLSLN
jgi:hypothetical protein